MYITQLCNSFDDSVESFYSSLGLFGPVVPFNLPDVGEAIMTVELKEWYAFF